jgi:hypothetical protein
LGKGEHHMGKFVSATDKYSFVHVLICVLMSDNTNHCFVSLTWANGQAKKKKKKKNVFVTLKYF